MYGLALDATIFIDIAMSNIANRSITLNKDSQILPETKFFRIYYINQINNLDDKNNKISKNPILNIDDM